MDSKFVHERIKDFSRIRENSGKDEIALTEMALFIEDMFGITLDRHRNLRKESGHS